MRAAIVSILAALALTVAGCETNNGTAASQAPDLDQRSNTTVSRMEAADPALANVVNNAYGYAIFPSVGQAAVGVGGAGGRGVAYQQGQAVGFATLNQGSIGVQLGGDTFAELVVFQTPDAMAVFRNGTLVFGADANATLVKAGAAAAGQFNHGTRIFIMPKGGLMAGVSIVGQKFTYTAGNTGNDSSGE